MTEKTELLPEPKLINTPKIDAPKPIRLNRMTLVLSLHHEYHDGQPTSVQTIAHKKLEIAEQAYSRTLIDAVTEEWQLVFAQLLKSRCWVEPQDVGYLCVENLVGKSLSVNPSPEERRELDAKVIELAISEGQNCLLIYPGWSFAGAVSDPSKVQLRCQHGTASCRIMVLPK